MIAAAAAAAAAAEAAVAAALAAARGAARTAAAAAACRPDSRRRWPPTPTRMDSLPPPLWEYVDTLMANFYFKWKTYN